MLNIPEDVKTLFKRDDVFKNFHVHFPNGETTDLNNDNVVSESVTFTESLCSQQSFRFGLTEASEIQFTAVGIPNVRGAVIECAIEIQVDDLGAEWLSDNAPTGTENFLDPQVCTYGSRNMYRVPYGRFIVDKCPRNHEGMWKREVTAYTERLTDLVANPFQTRTVNQYYLKNTYNPRVKPLAYSIMYNSEPDVLTERGYTKTAITPDSLADTIPATVYAPHTDGGTVTLTFTTTFARHRVTINDENERARTMFGADLSQSTAPNYKQLIVAELKRLGVDETRFPYGNYDSIEEAAEYGVLRRLGAWFEQDFYVGTADGTRILYEPRTQIDYSTALLYPYFQGAEPMVSLCAFTSTTITSNKTSETSTIDYGTATFYTYSDTSTDASGDYGIEFDSTLQTKQWINGFNRATYSFANAFSFSDFVGGFLELQCRFGSPRRTGGFEVTALDSTTSTSIIPSEYASLWYDETTIAPIGNIQLKFKDESGNEQDIVVQIGDGASVYDLRDNEVLKNMVFTVTNAEAQDGITIESKIIDFLNAVFVPNIPDLTFVPIELEKKGLPYFEAGDAVTITTGDGQTVPSFILRQTVKGIQFLQADVESANGEAVELIES